MEFEYYNLLAERLPQLLDLERPHLSTAPKIKKSIYRAFRNVKDLAKEDTLLPTQMFPRLPARATFVADTKKVTDFVQKHFVSATNVSQFAEPKKHHGQQCVRNNVSSFTGAFRVNKQCMHAQQCEASH